MSERRRDRKRRGDGSRGHFLGEFGEFFGEPRGDDGCTAFTVSAKQFDNVRSRDHHDRVLVFLDFLVGLQIDPARCHQNAELPMPEARNETRHFSNTNRVRCRIAFRFECKVHKNAAGPRPDAQLPYSIPSSISRGSSYIQCRNIRNYEAGNRCSAVFERVRN